MRTIPASLRPGIRALTKGRKPGDVLARLDIDPYRVSFGNASTHVLAPRLDEPSVHAVPIAPGGRLFARFPVACHIRLLRDGRPIAGATSDRLEHPVAERGVYRVEGWLTLDGEERPWLYSNPIYVH
ncbi:MAG TPA: hypothetical protein VGH33_14070 [Isosphaeraceae bacterium]|jgi:hypothetical protein